MKNIDSVHSYLCEIKNEPKLHYDNEEEILFFRGLSNKNYDLKPSLFRGCKKDLEKRAYQEIMVEYPEQFKRNEHVSNLVKMQHYGLKTRLLDVSRNPLISLYFACEQNPNDDGKVVCFKVKKSEVLHHNSDKALMLACLPYFSDVEKDEIKAFCKKHSGVITDKDIKNETVMQRFLHEVRSEFPAFETAIVGQDLLKNYFIAVCKDNPRMKVQDGAFVICGLDNDVSDLEKKAIELRIDYSAKKDILRDLKMLGIANNTVYPDFERTSMAIASDRKVEWVEI